MRLIGAADATEVRWHRGKKTALKNIVLET